MEELLATSLATLQQIGIGTLIMDDKLVLMTMPITDWHVTTYELYIQNRIYLFCSKLQLAGTMQTTMDKPWS